jgi:hypothetical protein
MPFDETINKPLPTFTPPPAFRGLAVGNESDPAAAQASQLGSAIQQAFKNKTTEAQGQYVANYKQQQASEFQQFMAKGPQALKDYVAEISIKNPDLGRQFTQEVAALEPYFSQPDMPPEEGRKMVFMALSSFNNRVTAANKPAPMDPTKVHAANRDYDIANPLPQTPKDRSAENERRRKREAAAVGIPEGIKSLADLFGDPVADENLSPSKSSNPAIFNDIVKSSVRKDRTMIYTDMEPADREMVKEQILRIQKMQIDAGKRVSSFKELLETLPDSTVMGGDDITLDDGLDAGQDSVELEDSPDAGMPYPEASSSAPQLVKTRAEYDALDSGTEYIDPNGVKGIKP